MNAWSLIAVAAVALSACQSKPDPTPRSFSSEERTQPICQPPPVGDGRCERECREDECDYEEAGEEAMIHVIEIDSPQNGSSASKEESLPTMPDAPAANNFQENVSDPAAIERPAERSTDSVTQSEAVEPSATTP